MSRHVIITGASRGIGAAIAEWFIAHGDHVVALSRSGDAPGGCAKTFAVDVADSSAVNAAVKSAIAEFGPVEVAVMNAGVTRDGLAMRMSDDQWREVLSTDLDGAFYGARATMASMVRATRRFDHLHRLDQSLRRGTRPGQLRRRQGWPRRTGARARQRGGVSRYHGERRGAGTH